MWRIARDPSIGNWRSGGRKIGGSGRGHAKLKTGEQRLRLVAEPLHTRGAEWANGELRELAEERPRLKAGTGGEIVEQRGEIGQIGLKNLLLPAWADVQTQRRAAERRQQERLAIRQPRARPGRAVAECTQAQAG